MRLLICLDCKTIEEVPDYDGPLEKALVPAPDGTLQEALVPPVGADYILEHLSEPHRRQEHTGNLVQVAEDEWRDTNKRIELLRQIKEGLTHGVGGGLGEEVYAFRNTLQEDALKCFQQHGRPDTCIDWHSRSKLLGNSLLSPDERQAAATVNRAVANLVKPGRGKKGPTKRYLCDFCPVASKVQQKKFDKDGLYN